MCLMCEQEDLYFLYLEQRERAEKRARRETSPPDPNWLWPTFVATLSRPAPVPARPAEPARAVKPPDATKPHLDPTFLCDAPE
jgi:hypothetical protein